MTRGRGVLGGLVGGEAGGLVGGFVGGDSRLVIGEFVGVEDVSIGETVGAKVMG